MRILTDSICRSSLSWRLFVPAVAVAVLAIPSAAMAQYPAPSESGAPVMGSGNVSITVPPDRLRALIPLSAQGESVEEAAKAMEDVLQAAKIQLKALGANGDSIRSTDLLIDNELKKKFDQIRSQMNSYGGGGMSFGGFGGGPGGPQVPTGDEQDNVVRVRRYVVADWPLKDSGFKLLAEAIALEKKVGETEFSADEGEGLSAEAAEMMEEAGMYMDDEEQVKGPKFYYLATISQKQHDELQEQAFEKAKKNADQLAKLASMQLGSVISISSGDIEFDPWAGRRGYYGGSENTLDQIGQALAKETPDDKIVMIAEDGNSQRYRVSLMVGFELKTGK